MLYVKEKHFFCRARKGLGTSLALQRYAGLIGSGFLCKVGYEITTGDKGTLLVLFYCFIYSLPTQHDCVLPVLDIVVKYRTKYDLLFAHTFFVLFLHVERIKKTDVNLLSRPR